MPWPTRSLSTAALLPVWPPCPSMPYRSSGIPDKRECPDTECALWRIPCKALSAFALSLPHFAPAIRGAIMPPRQFSPARRGGLVALIHNRAADLFQREPGKHVVKPRCHITSIRAIAVHDRANLLICRLAFIMPECSKAAHHVEQAT